MSLLRPKTFTSAPAGGPLTKKVTLSSAQILALNTTPITLLPAPGVGKAYCIQSVALKFTYGTATYSVSGNFQIKCSTASTNFLNSGSPLIQTSSYFHQPLLTTPGGAGTTIIENDSVVVTSATANPTVGDGTMSIYLVYAVISI